MGGHVKGGARIEQPRLCILCIVMISPVDEPSNEGTSPDGDSATWIWLPVEGWFESEELVFHSNFLPLPFLFND